MKYIDIHCHLDFKDYGEEITGVLERMRERDVVAITIGTDLESSKRAVKIANDNENVWACIGAHPQEKNVELWNMNYELWEGLIKNPRVVSVGECGLDYFRLDDESKKQKQKKLFKQQIEFAIKHNKPLMLHCRDSYDDVLNILGSYKKEAGDKLRGNAHFFAGSIEQAKRFLDLGFAMSFTGVITFTNDYDEVIKFIPTDFIMSETDAPFVAPVPYRGKRNEPSYVVEVVRKLAELKGQTETKMRTIILANAKRIFNLHT
jgi:TatD DNase family protein